MMRRRPLPRRAPCPFCGGHAVPQWVAAGAAVACSACGATGPRCQWPAEAVHAWNRHTRRPRTAERFEVL